MAKKKKKILLHTCCAPCTTYVHRWLGKHGWKVTGFFYNPNIHPYTEYTKRMDTLKLYAAVSALEMIYFDRYELEDFLQGTVNRAKARCFFCYLMRLYQTAKYAKAHGFPYFSTTLLISPHQNHEILKKAMELVSKRVGVKYFYHDFRKGYPESVGMARQMNLYRQKYCGCIFSERDRYAYHK